MAIYLNINQQQAGPFEIDNVNQMISLNQITLDTLGWMDGMPNWEPLNSETFFKLGIGNNRSPKLSNSESVKDPAVELGSPKGGGSIAIGSAIGEAFKFFKANFIGCIGWVVISGVLSCTAIGALLTPLLGVNLFSCAKRFQENGKKMEIGELFDFNKAVEKIFGPIILGFIIGIGFLILIIPGVILSMWWTFSPCVLADRPDLSFTDAMKASRAVAKGNWIKIILLFIVIGLLQIMGAMCLGIGLIVTIPVGHLALFYAYKQARG
jgi:hypothetical protein